MNNKVRQKQIDDKFPSLEPVCHLASVHLKLSRLSPGTLFKKASFLEPYHFPWIQAYKYLKSRPLKPTNSFPHFLRKLSPCSFPLSLLAIPPSNDHSLQNPIFPPSPDTSEVVPHQYSPLINFIWGRNIHSAPRFLLNCKSQRVNNHIRLATVITSLLTSSTTDTTSLPSTSPET